jgi:hypothetical protein
LSCWGLVRNKLLGRLRRIAKFVKVFPVEVRQ